MMNLASLNSGSNAKTAPPSDPDLPSASDSCVGSSALASGAVACEQAAMLKPSNNEISALLRNLMIS